MKITEILSEVSLGNYTSKATKARALAQMGAAFAGSPEEREKQNAIAQKRIKGLDMAKVRNDKKAAELKVKAQSDYEQQMRDKYAGVDIDAEIAKLQPAIKRAYNDYQYGARNTWHQGKAEYDRLSAQVRELEQAKKILGGEAESATGGAISTGGQATSNSKGRADSIVV